MIISQHERALERHLYYCEPTPNATTWDIRHPDYDRPLAVMENEYKAVGFVLTLRRINGKIYDQGVEDGYNIGFEAADAR